MKREWVNPGAFIFHWSAQWRKLVLHRAGGPVNSFRYVYTSAKFAL